MLSSIAPQLTNAAGTVAEGEGAWFKRALREANQIVALAPLAPAGSTDAVQDLFDELYVNMRSAMSHAKSGRKVLLPQDEGECADVTASLRRLVGLYLKLAETHLGATRAGGGIFAVAFRMMFAPTLGRMSMYVSDDESPFGQVGDFTESRWWFDDGPLPDRRPRHVNVVRGHEAKVIGWRGTSPLSRSSGALSAWSTTCPGSPRSSAVVLHWDRPSASRW